MGVPSPRWEWWDLLVRSGLTSHVSVNEADRFSTCEAKARFSEVLRRVREGRTVTVTYHGEPVAEIRPLDRPEGVAARLPWMRGRGLLSVPDARAIAFLRHRTRRGADLWHMATALYIADPPDDLDFLTLDADRRAAADALGFPTPLEVSSS